MKKFILLISFFVLFIFVASTNAYATISNTECWGKYLDEMAVCTQVTSKCSFACPDNYKTINDCLNKCGQEGNACNKQAGASYKACAEEGQVPTLSPKPAQSNSNNCWSEFDDATQTCLYASTNCNQNCPKGSNSIERHTVCLESCTSTFKICNGQASATYDSCIEAGKQAQKQPETNQTKPPENPELPYDEAACHETCQSNYDTCSSECRSADIFKSSSGTGNDDIASCGNCAAVYNTTFKSIHHDCFTTWSTCTIGIYNESDCQGISCSEIVEEKCNKPYDACIQPAEDAQNACLKGCGAGTDQESSSGTDACFNTCEQTRSSCSQSCREAGEAAKKETTQPTEKPSVGLSSRDFKSLAKAMNQLQVAEAELEKVKAAQDPRWAAKKDFTQQFQDELQKYPEEQQDTLQIVRDRLEEVKSNVELYQKAMDFAHWLKGSELDDDSGGVSTITSVGSGLIDFLDLLAEGVSVDDAIAKVLIDSTAVDLNPFVKTADMVATLPDEILAAFGIPPDHWSRKPTGYLNDNSPSAFVTLTTNTMIETQNFTNVGGALQVAWDDVKNAQGFDEKAQATIDLVGTAVGAVPVAAAMYLRDTVSTGFSAGGKTVDFISSWFTYPN